MSDTFIFSNKLLDIQLQNPSSKVSVLREINDYDLRDNDLQILGTFHDSDSKFAFQGLKRKLGMHQETLSRALRRLESEELVEHTLDGYRLTSRGSAIIKKAHGSRSEPRKILETYLPSDVSPSDIISRLKYSWFSALRWLGYTETKEGVILTWVTEDGSLQIRARFHGNRLSIETDSDREGLSQMSIKFAYELISRITKGYPSWNS